MLDSRRRRRKIVSYTLMAVGMVLFFLGARDVFYARFGQAEAEHAFDNLDVPRLPPFPSIDNSQPSEQAQPQREPKLKLGDAVAKLSIPRLDTELYVVEGDHASELRRGPGHVSGTALPGEGGNCIIAGHRDTHFRVLKDIRKGDEIILQTASGQYTYRVKTTQVVYPSNTASLRPTKSAELHLITCYPFYYLGSAPKRFIVEADLEDSAPSLTASASY